MSIRKKFFSQFRKPEGLLGALAGFMMAYRGSGRARNQWTAELLDPQPGDRILEIGCGPGLALADVDRALKDGHLVGLDHSALMLKQAARRNRRAVAAGRMTFVEGGVDAIARLGEPFDRVYSVNVVHLVGDRSVFFAAIDAILKPGGTVATTYMPPPTTSPADPQAIGADVSAILAALGYQSIRIETLDLDPPAICILATKPIAGS